MLAISTTPCAMYAATAMAKAPPMASSSSVIAVRIEYPQWRGRGGVRNAEIVAPRRRKMAPALNRVEFSPIRRRACILATAR